MVLMSQQTLGLPFSISYNTSHREQTIKMPIYHISTFLILLFSIQNVVGRLNLSTDELTKWAANTEGFIESTLMKLIKIQEENLDRIKSIAALEKRNSKILLEKDEMLHPIKAFAKLNSLIKSIDHIGDFLYNAQNKLKLVDLEFDALDNNSLLPNYDDLNAAGITLIRLKDFYDLDIDDLVKGKLGNVQDYDGDQQFHLNADDCFQLGRIAYHKGEYSNSISWLQKTLDLFGNREVSHDGDTEEMIVETLDYMAYAAYKLGKIHLAAEVTKLWIERDPKNERALKNLEYYEDMLESSHESIDIPSTQDVSNNNEDRYAKYKVSEDETVKDLCKGQSTRIQKSLFCHRKSFVGDNGIHLNVKVEYLSINPDIIQIHDIITIKEAEVIRNLSTPKLYRAVVITTNGTSESDFRIASTAWLKEDVHDYINRISLRLEDVFQLSSNYSEPLQVVNYGAGGYYGPHMDSYKNFKDCPENHKKHSERLATILIYLKDVEHGGSTVFPRLNLNIKPVTRSAIFWYNIKRNGTEDRDSMHAGCPILLGSKWIATKWIQESANIFKRPCGLTQDY